MRVPKIHLVTLKNGDCYSIEVLLYTKSERYFQDCRIDGVWCNTMIKCIVDNDFLFLIGNLSAKELGEFYRRRWCIEVLFQIFKGCGFDLESTHLKCSKKLSKLLVFVSIAVAMCVKVGEYHHKKVQKIKTSNNGRQANSFFRKGSDILRKGLKNTNDNFLQLCTESIEIMARYSNIL